MPVSTAKPKKEPNPLPPPEATNEAPSVSQPAPAADIIPGKPGRPFRMAGSFVSGTFRGALDGSALWGRRGMWAGAGIAMILIMAGMGGGLLLPIFAGAVIGLAVGAVGGLVGGALLGGGFGVAKQKRIEGNQDAVEARDKARPIQQDMVQYGPDTRAAYREQQQNRNYLIDRILQSEKENRQDSWVNRVTDDHNHHHWRG